MLTLRDAFVANTEDPRSLELEEAELVPVDSKMKSKYKKVSKGF